MNTYRRVVLIATVLAATSLWIVSCGDDDGTKPPPPPPAAPAFTWQNPRPTGDAIRGVWGSAMNNVYAVGSAGTLLHYDGSSWRMLTTRLGEDVMWDVWGAASNDIHAVGDNGAIWHYDGSGWSKMVSGTDVRLRGVSGLPSGEVYAVGDAGTIRRRIGANWLDEPQSVTTANLIAVWMAPTGEVYVLTDDTSVSLIQRVGSSWVPVNRLPSINAHDIWGTSNEDIFVVGSVGTIAHFTTVGGWDFTSPGGTETLYGVFGTSPSSVFAVGSNSTILEYDGTSWMPAAGVSGAFDLFAVWEAGVPPNNEVHALGASGGIYSRGVGWSLVSSSVSTTNIRSVSAAGSNKFAAGEDGTVLSNPGTGWTTLITGTLTDLNGIFAIGANNAIAVGVGAEAIHYDGTDNWPSMNTAGATGDLAGVWGTSGNDVVAVGGNNVLHYDGNAGNVWTTMASTVDPSGLLAVWGSATDDMVAVGRNGMILRWNGTQWAPAPEGSPVSTTLRAVSGTASDDIYAAGDNGVVIHYDGSDWTDVMMGQFQVDLHGVAISSAFGVYASGDLGAICYRKNPGQWEERSYTNQSQSSIAVDGTGSVFFVGQGGAIIRWGQ